MWDRYGVRKTLARQPRATTSAGRRFLVLALLLVPLLALGTAAAWKALRSPPLRRTDANLPGTARSTPLARAENLLVFGFNPTFDVGEVRRIATGFVQELSVASGLDVRAVVGSSYNDLVDGMQLGDVDAAFVTPIAYARGGLINVSRPVLRVVRNPGAQDKYFAAIVARKGARTARTGLASLCGRKVGYTELDSSSGYIYAKLTLLQSLDHLGVSQCDLRQEAFLGGHKAVLDALKRGEIEFGAVFANDTLGQRGAWNQLGDYQVDVVAVSEPIPSDGLMVRLSVSDWKVRRLVQGLRALMTRESGRQKLQKLLGADSFIEGRVGDYNSVVSALARFEKLSHKYGKADSAK